MLNNLISSPTFRQYSAVIAVNLIVICIGMGMTWTSPVLVKLSAVNGTDNVLSRPITENEGSWIVSIGFLVSSVVNLFCPYLVNELGRKYSVLLACAPKLTSVILFIFASELWMILLGRCVNSIGDSIILTVVPMYASEIASKEIRGGLGSILQIATSIGILIVYSVGPFLSYLALNIVFLCLTIATTIPILFVPDSPYFLYVKGDTETALKVLIYLRGSETLAKEEISEYASMTNNEEKLNTTTLLHDKIFLKAVFIVLVLSFGLQAVGTNSVQFYLQTILESTDTIIQPEIASAVVGFIQLVASLCTASVTDRFGRKPIFTTTLYFMAIGMFGLGIFFYLQIGGREITGALNFLPLASLIVVVFSDSAGCGSLFWNLMAELFEGRTRGIGCTIGICSCTLFIFISSKYFAALSSAIGPPATYWMFSACCVLFSLFITFVLPETKGKTFAEIQIALGGKQKKIDKKMNKIACGSNNNKDVPVLVKNK